MSEQQFGWNYFENEVVIGDKQDKKRMIVIVLSNFMDIPYNRKSFDELVDWLNELSEENNKLKEINKDKEQDVLHLYKENEQLEQKIKDKNKYQRVLEAKIRRLKDRIKVLEK